MTADPIQKKHYEHRRWHLYGLALLLMVVVTSVEVAFYYREGLVPIFEVVNGMVTIGGVLGWCIYDSLARGYRVSSGYKLGIALMGVIFIPMYFWDTRGFKKSAKSLFGLCLYAPFYGAYYGAWYLAAEILTRIGYFSPG